MTKKIKVGVVFGGASSEHEVSLASAKNVLDAIDRERFDVLEIGVTKQGRWVVGPGAHTYLLSLASEELLPAGMDRVLEEESAKFLPAAQSKSREERKEFVRKELLPSLQVSETRLPATSGISLAGLDVIFPLIHGTTGEDGALQGLCRLLNVAVVGCGVLASAVAMDKIMTNQVLTAAGIPKARWTWVSKSEVPTAHGRVHREIMEKLGGYPVFVKPANTGSSVGVVKVHDEDELDGGLEEAARFDRRVLIEQNISGRELEIAVLGREKIIVSPVVSEIIPENEFYDYEAKYLDGKTRIELPAKVSPSVVSRMQEIATQAFRAIDGCGMARIDFFYVEAEDKLYLNEINTIPGFTKISQYPSLMKMAGMTYSEIITKLLEIALERFDEERLREV